MTPQLSIGIGANTSLKASYWDATLGETHVNGDPRFLSVVLHRGGGRVWRNAERTPATAGSVGMQPFAHSLWRFEGRVSFVQVYVPFELLRSVCESLFGRELAHEQLWIAMGCRDRELCGTMRAIASGLRNSEPTSLLLDSWALRLSEVLVRRFSGHAGAPAHGSFGRIPSWRMAQVVDFVETHLGADLDLASLAGIAALSRYHFARRFRETVGVSPHAYVISRRIERARMMLTQEGHSLAEVATSCGFANQAHFTNVFRASLGMTPGEYRRTAR